MNVIGIEKRIEQKARALGFDAVGFTTPERLPDGRHRHFREFLKRGWHGDMAWLKAKARRRERPDNLWPEVKGIVMVGLNYGPGRDPLTNLKRKTRGTISVYAQGRDYHDLIKKRLKALGRWLVEEYETPVKVFVDTAPVMEKPLSEAAGLGWQGKHTNLVSTRFGSWLFLGAVFTTLKLKPSPAHPDRCGSCHACLDVCPTNAFPAPYKLDARRCISYLTIEHKGPIPRKFRKAIGNRIYGCDDCLAVCPWNKYARKSHELFYFVRKELASPALAGLLTLDDAAFRKLFCKSPVKRTGRDRFVRNVLIAAGNSAEPSLLQKVQVLLADPSPLVRGAAAWAFQQLANEQDIEKERAAGLADPDASVRAEWRED